ncbi:MAG: hypothetical protein ACFCUQ_10990 [Kiloniellales bacterium]
MAEKGKVQGEGDYEAARRFRKESERFAETGDVKGAAEKAKRAVEGDEAGELKKAEKAGKSRAKGVEPKAKKG